MVNYGDAFLQGMSQGQALTQNQLSLLQQVEKEADEQKRWEIMREEARQNYNLQREQFNETKKAREQEADYRESVNPLLSTEQIAKMRFANQSNPYVSAALTGMIEAGGQWRQDDVERAMARALDMEKMGIERGRLSATAGYYDFLKQQAADQVKVQQKRYEGELKRRQIDEGLEGVFPGAAMSAPTPTSYEEEQKAALEERFGPTGARFLQGALDTALFTNPLVRKIREAGEGVNAFFYDTKKYKESDSANLELLRSTSEKAKQVLAAAAKQRGILGIEDRPHSDYMLALTNSMLGAIDEASANMTRSAKKKNAELMQEVERIRGRLRDVSASGTMDTDQKLRLLQARQSGELQKALTLEAVKGMQGETPEELQENLFGRMQATRNVLGGF